MLVHMSVPKAAGTRFAVFVVIFFKEFLKLNCFDLLWLYVI